jgi:hypothetical protein
MTDSVNSIRKNGKEKNRQVIAKSLKSLILTEFFGQNKALKGMI